MCFSQAWALVRTDVHEPNRSISNVLAGKEAPLILQEWREQLRGSHRSLNTGEGEELVITFIIRGCARETVCVCVCVCVCACAVPGRQDGVLVKARADVLSDVGVFIAGDARQGVVGFAHSQEERRVVAGG